MKGSVNRNTKLRIGYFSQHQTDELDVNATPFQEMSNLMRNKNTEVKDHVVRAKLAAFGFNRDLVDNPIGTLSGGEKARLLFAFMSFDSPHLLILDEPTNHLDIDAREALVQALNAYDGAIIIVSHDPTMVERVADRLWLIRDGVVQNFEGDLEDYRNFTIQAKRDAKKNERKDSKAVAKAGNNAQNKKYSKKEIVKIEKDVSRLTEQKYALEVQMADPNFYTNGTDVAEIQKNYQNICAQLTVAEAAWLDVHTEIGA
jgi:ATP-binding cassette subfamily F protein 3